MRIFVVYIEPRYGAHTGYLESHRLFLLPCSPIQTPLLLLSRYIGGGVRP